jgi:homoserine dehydrogenase
VVLRLAGVADRRATLLDEAGVDLAAWRERLAAAPESGPFDAAAAPAVLDRLARLPRPILVDLTNAEGMEEVYEQAFRRGIDVVGSNKLPLAVPGRRLLALREARRQTHRSFAYDTSVGASLPVLDTLRKLVQAGDRVHRIEGALSGTVGYLCAELQKGVPLSMAVRWAVGLGYAELDARDDLGGLESARKAVVLAREAGLALELAEVRLTPFVPAELLGPEALIASLRRHDAALAAQVERLKGEGRVLRYLTTIVATGDGRADVTVAPAELDARHPAANLSGVEAFVAFTTERHAERPLVVQGTCVGGPLAAGGILGEILRVAERGGGVGGI